MYKFGSIEQFRNVCHHVKQTSCYNGKDENGKAIYDINLPLPTITFTGTEKIHGTNSSIVLTKDGEYYAESKERVLSLDSDNAHFYVYAMKHKDYFVGLMNRYFEIFDIAIPDAVVLVGEWAGSEIQKGVAISALPKSLYVFELKLICGTETTRLNHDLETFYNPSINLFPIDMFKRWSIDINFNEPELSINQMVQWTNEVENESPVGKYFNVSGIGEGIVFVAEYKGQILRFKVKGDKHSTSKVKTIATVDVEKINSVKEFADYAVTENRLEQAISVMKENNIEPSDKTIGHFIKWINGDIAKEEMDTIIENELDMKMVSKYSTQKAKTWYIEKYF
jgi:hypothetical protein